MHKKSIVILLSVTFLVFANSLLNGFVGDDNFLIVNNAFYMSWENVKDLFTSKYITQAVDALSVQDQKQYFSGSVAYRPVLSLTYFLDYALWDIKPMGYHLTNLLWHLANVLGVYFLIYTVSQKINLALLSALVFSAHPFKSEAVCSIGYRADLVSCFFLIVSLLLYICYTKNSQKILCLTGSVITFGLALFAKESVIVYPAILIGYDFFIGRTAGRALISKKYIGRYFGYWLVCLIYLYVYLFVFPNKSVGTSWFNGGILAHTVTNIYIFADYFRGFFIPVLVKLLPPVYLPIIPALFGGLTLGMGLIIVLCGYIFIKLARLSKVTAFFVFWFFIALIPVLNIIPLANPMAYRFLYLPSIGMSVVLVRLMMEIGTWLDVKTKGNHFCQILMVAYLASCAITTIPLNVAWKHDHIMAFQLYKNHPRSPTSHLFMGITLDVIGEKKMAQEVILKGLQLGLRDPRAYYVLGRSTMDQPEVSRDYFKQGLKEYPDYAMLHLGAGRGELFAGNTDNALNHLKKSIELTPSYRGYCYLTQAYIMLDEANKAMGTLEEVKRVMPDVKYHEFLSNIIAHRKTLTFPQDVGL